MPPRAAFIHSPEIERLRYPPDCPFRTERAGMTKVLLSSMGLYTGEDRVEIVPAPATREEAERYHASQYLDTLERVSRGSIGPEDLHLGLGQEDTPVFKDLYNYAMLAAGATLAGARLLLDGAADIVFNPSGGFHHAFPARAGGFCYVNDVVLACMLLSRAGKRVFCLDLDAHHGNGTQQAFYGDPSVFTVSMHESGKTLYPWGGFEREIGEGDGLGYNVNVPLPAGTDDALFLCAFRQIVPPLLRTYRPDIIVLEIGMDVLAGDPLTHLRMTNNAVADVLPEIMASGRPILATGGGGYHPQNTARGWALAWTVLCGMEETNDEWAGMGGVFLGSSEWEAGLRDMHSYTASPKGNEAGEIAQTIDHIRTHVFPIHGLD